VQNYELLAKQIRSNATHILKSKKIEQHLKEIGQLFYTGSYAMDLMTWNDIDMQLVLKDGVDPKDALGDFFLQISKDPDFVEAQMIDFKGDYKPKMPRGVYLGFRLNLEKWGGLWKLDLWVLSKQDFDANRSLIEILMKKIDPSTRSFLLMLKHEMMSGNERVPQMGSHLLYQAVLLKGIRDREGLFEFFNEHNIAFKK